MLRKLKAFLLVTSLIALPLSVYGQMKWKCETPSGGFGKLNAAQAVEYKQKLWLVAGYSPTNKAPVPYVWYSSDGKVWAKERDTLPHLIRTEFAMLVFKDTLYTIGGYQGC